MFQYGGLFIFLQLSPFSIQWELQGFKSQSLFASNYVLKVWSFCFRLHHFYIIEFCGRSIHLLFYWILFENVMSLHRTKATLIGLLEAGRANEWVVTAKLGDSVNKNKSDSAKNKTNVTKPIKKPRLKLSERLGFAIYILQNMKILIPHKFDIYIFNVLFHTFRKANFVHWCLLLVVNRFHFLELGFAAFLFVCGCYDFVNGKNNYFVYLFLQTISFSIVGFGYVGTIVWSSFIRFTRQNWCFTCDFTKFKCM